MHYSCTHMATLDVKRVKCCVVAQGTSNMRFISESSTAFYAYFEVLFLCLSKTSLRSCIICLIRFLAKCVKDP